MKSQFYHLSRYISVLIIIPVISIVLLLFKPIPLIYLTVYQASMQEHFYGNEKIVFKNMTRCKIFGYYIKKVMKNNLKG